MFKFRQLSACWVCLAVVIAVGVPRAYADKFDDAVNHYLRGFESCKEANGSLRSNQVPKARSQMETYDKFFAEAQKMDPTIANTARRGMEGNIKFCIRVSDNIQVEEGTPYMDKAIAECDSAQKQLKAGNPDQANTHLENFRTHKDKAISVAPKMMDIFAIASQVRRCERLEKKISKSSQKQEAQQLSIESAKEESSSYALTCEQAIKTLEDNAVDDTLIKTAEKAIVSAKSHKKNAQEETIAFKVFEDTPDHEEKAPVMDNLARGDKCITQATKLVSSKERELAKIKKGFDEFISKLNRAQDECDKAERAVKSLANDSNYDIAKKLFQSAQGEERTIRNQLKSDADYRTYSNWPQVKRINADLGKVSSCVDDAEKDLTKMYSTIQSEKKRLAKLESDKVEKERAEAARIAKEKADAARKAREEAERQRLAFEKAEQERISKLKAEDAAKARAEAEARRVAQLKAEKEAQAAADAAAAVAAAADAAFAKAKAEAEAELARKTEVSRSGEALGTIQSIDVKIKFDGLAPDYALIYVEDASSPVSNISIELDKNGFDKDKYVVGPDTSIEIKNADNSLHRISAIDQYNGFNESLVRLYPRQRQRTKVSWPINRIVEIRSEKGVLASSEIINIPSNSYKIEVFSVGSVDVSFKYDIKAKGVTKAYLLIPNHDVIMVDFSTGSTISKPVIQRNEPVGSVLFNAL